MVNSYIIILLLQVILVIWTSEKNVGQEKRSDTIPAKINANYV